MSLGVVQLANTGMMQAGFPPTLGALCAWSDQGFEGLWHTPVGLSSRHPNLKDSTHPQRNTMDLSRPKWLTPLPTRICGLGTDVGSCNLSTNGI